MTPRVRVLLGVLDDQRSDATVHVVRRLPDDIDSRILLALPRPVIEVRGPAWSQREDREHLLARAYRETLACGDRLGAKLIAIPTELSYGPWPLDSAIRVALTALESTPTGVRAVDVVVPTPGALERWSEALARRPARSR